MSVKIKHVSTGLAGKGTSAFVSVRAVKYNGENQVVFDFVTTEVPGTGTGVYCSNISVDTAREIRDALSKAIAESS